MESQSFKHRFQNKFSLVSRGGLFEISEKNKIAKVSIPQTKSYNFSPELKTDLLGLQLKTSRVRTKTKTLSSAQNDLIEFNLINSPLKKHCQTERNIKKVFKLEPLQQGTIFFDGEVKGGKRDVKRHNSDVLFSNRPKGHLERRKASFGCGFDGSYGKVRNEVRIEKIYEFR